jgi:hypothetical protein
LRGWPPLSLPGLRPSGSGGARPPSPLRTGLPQASIPSNSRCSPRVRVSVPIEPRSSFLLRPERLACLGVRSGNAVTGNAVTGYSILHPRSLVNCVSELSILSPHFPSPHFPPRRAPRESQLDSRRSAARETGRDLKLLPYLWPSGPKPPSPRALKPQRGRWYTESRAGGALHGRAGRVVVSINEASARGEKGDNKC